ncbi:MAG: carboxypeptidase regulatory-like domain-containing protein [Planctomycetes bacterium]|nr:carboxypeptidase regulatory-like domain-containing protein [Planctomycetota bacterium]
MTGRASGFIRGHASKARSGRGAVVAILIIVVLVLVGLGVWFAMSDAAAPVGSLARQGSAATKSSDPPAAEPKKRIRAGRHWTQLGTGEVRGVVLEYGSEKPLGGVAVTLGAGVPGPGSALEAVTLSDGTFRIVGVPNFDDWTLRVKTKTPLRELEQAAVSVVENKVTELGVLYVTPAFAVIGVVVDEQGAPIEGAEVRALRSRQGGSQMDILRLIRELPVETPAVDRATTADGGRFRLTKTSPGSYDFKVVKGGRQVLVEKQVVVTPDAEKRPLRFVMSKGFQLDGRVSRKGPGPVAGIPVVAFREPQGELDLLVLDRCFAVTDEEGKFHLDGLGLGKFIVSATPEGEPFTIQNDVQIPVVKWLEVVIEGDAWLEGKVAGAGGAAIAGAQVYIANFDSKPVVASTRTDGDGRYSVRGLKSGKVQLFLVQAEGYATWPTDLMAALQGGGSGGLELKPGRNEKDVSLAPGGTIAGVVMSKDEEKPLEGVKVELGSILMMFGGSRSATTDAQGKFELTSVPLGTSVLIFSKEGWFQPGMTPESLGMAFMGGAGSTKADSGKGYVVSISEPGQKVQRTAFLARGTTLSGQVVAPDGTPVAGARVELRDDKQDGFMGGLAAVFGGRDPRFTDAEGRFEMPGPQPGTKTRVAATAPGFLEGKSDLVTAGVGQKLDGVAVRLRLGAMLEGKVSDDRGQPIDGAFVRWLNSEGLNEWEVDWKLRAARPSLTDADGRYRMENVEPGKVMVQVEHPRYLRLTEKDVATAEGKASQFDAKLRLGAVIDGRVVGPDGKPLSGANVSLTLRGEGGPNQWARVRDGAVTSESDGRFRAEGLEPGTYDVVAAQKSFAPSEKVTAEAGGPSITLRLQVALRIGGVVRADGQPVARVSVQVLRRGGAGSNASSGAGGQSTSEDANWEQVQSTESGTGGRFTFDDVAAGVYRLQFSPPAWGDARPNVLKRTLFDVSAGNDGLVVDLQAGLSISGSIALDDGTPVARGWASAWLVGANGGPAAGVDNAWASFEGGEFTLVGLVPGTWEVQLNAQGAGTKRVRVEAGRTDLRIVIGAGAKIAGRVVLEDGSAGSGLWVNATNGQGGQGAATDTDGRYTIVGLEPGRYRLDAAKFGSGGVSGFAEGVDARVGETIEAPVITARVVAVPPPDGR